MAFAAIAKAFAGDLLSQGVSHGLQALSSRKHFGFLRKQGLTPQEIVSGGSGGSPGSSVQLGNAGGEAVQADTTLQAKRIDQETAIQTAEINADATRDAAGVGSDADRHPASRQAAVAEAQLLLEQKLHPQRLRRLKAEIAHTINATRLTGNQAVIAGIQANLAPEFERARLTREQATNLTVLGVEALRTGDSDLWVALAAALGLTVVGAKTLLRGSRSGPRGKSGSRHSRDEPYLGRKRQDHPDDRASWKSKEYWRKHARRDGARTGSGSSLY